jgi:molybdopterin molybdotransferase
MVSYDEALRTILDNVSPVGSEQVPLSEAVALVLAETVTTPWDLPLWDNSAMDGYAVRTEDCGQPPCKLRVTGYLPAGASAEGMTVTTGCAIKIMTGAPLPAGADAVVPVEETEETSGEQVAIGAAVKVGQHIRRQGEDIRQGETILQAGSPLRAAEISLLASCGKPLVNVQRRPVVAILSTGDELVEPGTPPGPAQLINSNSIALAAAVREAGAMPRMLGIARDNRLSHLEKMRAGLTADCLITSAGVSAGDRDLVRAVLEELGVKFLFWKVAIKPGKPTAFGIFEGKPVFCLPGNPVSSLVTFEAFVRPALLKMQGRHKLLRPTLQATLREPLTGGSRMQFLRVALEQEAGRWFARSAGNQETGILRTSLLADGVAQIPANSAYESGAEINVQLLGEPL